MPWNIYSHCLVTYRTVVLRTNLKLLSFLLMPIVHLLHPPFAFVLSLIGYALYFAALSIAGSPSEPWDRIIPLHKEIWEKLVSEVKLFNENYGHPSGIPEDWDGRVYGLPIGIIDIVVGLFLYLVSVIPLSIGVAGIFVVKAVPIFLATLG